MARLLAALVLLLATTAPGAADDAARVVRVLDGDTIVAVAGAREIHVRLIGIDTPELHASEKLDRDAARSGRPVEAIQADGARARDAAEQLLRGRTVRLEYDVERTDRYDRTLAWVWLPDGTLANERLVRDGWARVYTHRPNVRHVAALRAAQDAARAAGAGLWAAAPPPARAPAGSAAPGPDGSCPASHPWKGNQTVRRGRPVCIVHGPHDPWWEKTRAERCYASEAAAVADGCRRARR
jgi:micrococcal nuclease